MMFLTGKAPGTRYVMKNLSSSCLLLCGSCCNTTLCRCCIHSCISFLITRAYHLTIVQKAIFWHLNSVNPLLEKEYDKWMDAFKARIATNPSSDINPKALNFFVPLCGKTVDMLFFISKGHHVVGLEAVNKAFVEFAQENSLVLHERHRRSLSPLLRNSFHVYDAVGKAPAPVLPSSGKQCVAPSADEAEGKATVDVSGRLTLLEGNLFHLGGEGKDDKALEAAGITGQFEGWFDRGSLVAIDPKLREDYVQLVDRLLCVGGSMLIFTVDYEQHLMTGPPFSVPFATVQALFAGIKGSTYEVKLVSEVDIDLSTYPAGHKRRALNYMKDLVIHVTKLA